MAHKQNQIKNKAASDIYLCAANDWTDNGLFIYRVVKQFVVSGNNYQVSCNSKHVRQGKAVQAAVSGSRLI